MDDDLSCESIEIPEMPEPKNTFQNWALGVIGSLLVIAIASGIGMAIANSNHFGRLDTIIEIQSKQHEEDKGKLDKIVEKIDGLPKTQTLSDIVDRLKANEQLGVNRGLELTRISQLVTDNRHAAEARMDSLESTVKIYSNRQWGAYNMDRWISFAEKKLGKPLPSVQDVTGREPGQP